MWGDMEKTIDLENDPVFRRAVHLRENRNYNAAGGISETIRGRAQEVRRQIAVMARIGRLDAKDMQIISMRQLSPMPTWREVGHTVGMSKQAANKRIQKIQNAMESIQI